MEILDQYREHGLNEDERSRGEGLRMMERMRG
jgi:hypothetical protein